MLTESILTSGHLQARVADGGARIVWRDTRRNERLIDAEAGVWMTPTLDGKPAALGVPSVEAEGAHTLRLRYGGDGLRDFTVELKVVPGEDAFDLSCSFTAARACQLNALDLLPAGTLLNLYDVVNFRNRHHTPRVWPELLLGGAGCETDTYSGDWQFAPHPAMLLFNKLHSRLFLGAFDLTTAYGLYFKARDYRVEHCRLDYGAAPHGQRLEAAETFQSPRIRLFLRHNVSEWEMFEDFGAMLVRGAVIPDPAAKAREAWWTEPLYCTWIDQCFKSAYLPPAELQEQVANCDGPTRKVFTEALVREAVAVIHREKLPFRTILLDEGWHVARGQWEPHPARFPDLRGLVDELHAAGFKVVVWWNWAEIEETAEANPAHLMADGKLNKHGCRMRDYSLEATQEEYLKPLFHRLFSSDDGCYDLDGVKTDFLADKVHPDLSPADPAWRGEENYFLKVTELFYREMKRWKPDAVHIGCAGNYHLAHLIDINRTYDVSPCDPREHEQRARMLRCTTPGCPVAYDFQGALENYPEYLASARRIGASVQIGNVLLTQPDRFSKTETPSPDYYAMLRRML
jgi:hypothetical protein